MNAKKLPLVEDDFLQWFAGAGYPMLETKLRLGSLEYFHFSSYFTQDDGRAIASFGSALTRKSAALKCAGEAIERQAMARFFKNQNHSIPAAFRNSNGWAVFTSSEGAVEKAKSEALERHLLLKSFLIQGWHGFNFVQDIEAGEINMRLLTSRFTSSGKIAGIVAAKSKSYEGVSFGYCLGDVGNVSSAEFWQSAIFEAVDKFLVLEKQEPGAVDQNSWLRRSVNHFLNTPFDIAKLGETNTTLIDCDAGEFETYTENLQDKFALEFPLYTSFVYGGDLIPLFWKSELQPDGEAALLRILERNGIFKIPEEHPIL